MHVIVKMKIYIYVIRVRIELVVLLTRVKLGANKLKKKGFAEQIGKKIEGCCQPKQVGDEASGCYLHCNHSLYHNCFTIIINIVILC